MHGMIKYMAEVVRTIKFTHVLNGTGLSFFGYTDQHILQPAGRGR